MEHSFSTIFKDKETTNSYKLVKIGKFSDEKFEIQKYLRAAILYELLDVTELEIKFKY